MEQWKCLNFNQVDFPSSLNTDFPIFHVQIFAVCYLLCVCVRVTVVLADTTYSQLYVFFDYFSIFPDYFSIFSDYFSIIPDLFLYISSLFQYI